MTEKIKSIPDGYHSINIYILVNDAAQAINFYQTAFGVQEKSRFVTPDGKIMHAELQIGDSTLQLSDEFQEHESDIKSPHSIKVTSCIIHLYVQDVDKIFESAIKAGAKIKRNLDNMFWGDRYGQLIDPFGHIWSIATRIESVTPDQVKERAAKFAMQGC
ncbi:MAG: VOC family protein [Gammaproteobacteria bacterium]|nr:VOC family protein [Gammaproteobacteria bacterium]MCW5583784.1 VOC family protein [Gammaproteobacteria bacterium]